MGSNYHPARGTTWQVTASDCPPLRSRTLAV